MSIEDRLRTTLDTRADSARLSQDAWEGIEAGLARRRRRRAAAGFGAAGVALVVVVASSAWLWSGLRGGPGPGTESEPPLDPRVTATIEVGDYPAGVAADERAVWVVLPSARPGEECGGEVVRVDPGTNRVAARISIHGWPSNVASGFGSVWVEGFLCTEAGDIPAVTRIDPVTNEVLGAVELGEPGAGATSADVAVGEGAVWVTLSADPVANSGEVVRIDPGTGLISARIPVEGTPRDVVVGEGGVFVLSLLPGEEAHLCGSEAPCETAPGSFSGMEVLHIDPLTNEVVDSYPNALSVGVGEGAVWAGVWLTQGDLGLVRLDPRSGRPIGEPLRRDLRGFAGEHGTIGTLVVGDGGVWLWGFPTAESTRGLIYRLNATTLEVDASVAAEGTWIDATLDPSGDALWVSTYEGGVIRIDLR